METKHQNDLATALAEMVDFLNISVEAVVGHRKVLEAHGFSEAIAEAMAAEFYRQLLTLMFVKIQGGH